jgi:hypothetical protein
MLPYLICFSASSFLLWFGQNIRHGQSELFRWFIYGIALLIPVVLAGVRDLSVGTDVLFYSYPAFKEACTVPSVEGFSALYDDWLGAGFLWLNFAISHITHNYHIFLFLLMLLQILFVFFGIYKWRDKFPIWLGMFAFYTFFFNQSLNQMRQTLALSIVFFGIKYIFERKFFYFAFWVFAGFLFHKSVLFALFFYPLFWYVNAFTSKKSKILFFAVLLSSMIFLNAVVPLLLNFIPYASSAERLWNYINDTQDNFPYKNLVFYSFLAILFLYKRKIILSNFTIETGRFLEILVVFIAVVQLLYYFSGIVNRILYNVTWWECFLIPIMFCSYKTIGRICIIAVCLFYWYSYYWLSFLDYTGTRDYSSAILSNIF